jgi:hypothetical protein
MFFYVVFFFGGGGSPIYLFLRGAWIRTQKAVEPHYFCISLCLKKKDSLLLNSEEFTERESLV